MSNSLDPNQARHNVGPDLGPNCLQRLSGDALVDKELINDLCRRININHFPAE